MKIILKDTTRYEDKVMLIRYNSREINARVDIKQVMSMYAGIYQTDNNANVPCPNPAHKDKNPSAKINDIRHGNNVFCFTCCANGDRAFDPITIVSWYATGNNFPKACERLIADFNLPLEEVSNIREIEKSGQTIEHQNTAPFPLSGEECNILGLADGKNKDTIPYTLLSQWENNNKQTLEMLTDIVNQKIERYNDIISAEEIRFKKVYSLHTAVEWNNAKLYHKMADDLTKISSPVKFLKFQRDFINDVKEIYNIAEHIAECEKERELVKEIEAKLSHSIVKTNEPTKSNVPVSER